MKAFVLTLLFPFAALAQCQQPAALAYPQPSLDVSALCQQALGALQIQQTTTTTSYAVPVAAPAVSYAAAPAYAAPVYAPMLAVPSYAYGVGVRSYGYGVGVNRSFGASYGAFAGHATGFAGRPIIVNNFPARGFGGGGGVFGALGARAAAGASQGGLLGAAEGLTGLGNGSGQFLEGALIGRFLPGGGGFRFKK